MIVRFEVLLLISLCMLVTIVPRTIPLMLIGRVSLPPLVIAWLRHIPIAVITALLCQELLLQDAGVNWARLLAGLFALALAFTTRSILGTVILGVAVYALLLHWLG